MPHEGAKACMKKNAMLAHSMTPTETAAFVPKLNTFPQNIPPRSLAADTCRQQKSVLRPVQMQSEQQACLNSTIIPAASAINCCQHQTDTSKQPVTSSNTTVSPATPGCTASAPPCNITCHHTPHARLGCWPLCRAQSLASENIFFEIRSCLGLARLRQHRT